jgi:hypothetical protein
MLSEFEAIIPATACTFYSLLSAYPIVSTLARYLTSRDLIHLALANYARYSLIFPSRSDFEALNRFCICRGEGKNAHHLRTGGSCRRPHQLHLNGFSGGTTLRQ